MMMLRCKPRNVNQARGLKKRAVLTRAVASSSQDVKTITLKAQRITPEAFAPFGQVRGGGEETEKRSRERTIAASSAPRARGATPSTAIQQN